jgi:hypothetical protein
MSRDRERNWEELEARAQRLLEHAREVEPRDHVRSYGSVLRLWQFPVFGLKQTWTILTPGRRTPVGAGLLVREVTWDRSADNRRVFEENGGGNGNATSPSIRLREAKLPVLELDRLLALGVTLTVPMVISGNTVGLDGEYFGLETYTVSPNVRVQWWGAGPTEWRHFTDWVAELRTFLERTLDQTV